MKVEKLEAITSQQTTVSKWLFVAPQRLYIAVEKKKINDDISN